MPSRVRKLAFAGAIAGVYAALTVFLMPFSYGPIQFRVSEALAILPYFFPIAVPGLFVGCAIANLFNPSGFNLIDMVFGSLATLVAALITMRIGKSRDSDSVSLKILACLPPILLNAVVVGAMLSMVGTGNAKAFWPAFVEFSLYVGFGEAVVIFLLGLPFMIYLPRMGVVDRLKEIINCPTSGND